MDLKPKQIVPKETLEDEDQDEAVPENEDPNAGRFVRYQFTPQFLKLRTVGAT